MSFEGHIENGVVVFDEPVSLPNGTPVKVQIAESAKSKPLPRTEAGHFLKHYQAVIGTVTDLPEDAASNVDHYLYGMPKK